MYQLVHLSLFWRKSKRLFCYKKKCTFAPTVTLSIIFIGTQLIINITHENKQKKFY